MHFTLRNNFDARPYIHVSCETLPVAEWDWHGPFGPVKVGIHPSGLAQWTPWEMPVADVNKHLPARLWLTECIMGHEQRVAAVTLATAKNLGLV